MADGNITKDTMYDAVAPGRLRVDAGAGPLRRALDRLRQDHLARPTTTSGIRSTRSTSTSTSPSTWRTRRMLPEEHDPRPAACPTSPSTLTGPARSDRASSTTCTLRQLLLDPARRAGRAEPVGLLCHVLLRPGRAGIRRQPDPRRSPPRHRLRQVHQGPLGPAAPCGAALKQPAGRDHRGAGGLQEDHRHADAGRGPGHGRLRHRLPATTATRWPRSCSSW